MAGADAPVMQIDPAKQQASVKSQEDRLASRRASLVFARQQYERVSGLFDAGVTSQQDMDQARTALDAAQAELQAAEAQLREQQVQLTYYRVSAPRDGIVGDIPVRVGDRVTVSTLLTTVDQPDSSRRTCPSRSSARPACASGCWSGSSTPAARSWRTATSRSSRPRWTVRCRPCW